MTDKRVLIAVSGLAILVIAIPVGRYLASPLFIDNEVDEAFPFDASSQAEMDEMTDAELELLEASQFHGGYTRRRTGGGPFAAV